jgi:hypothetical protein
MQGGGGEHACDTQQETCHVFEGSMLREERAAACMHTAGSP